MLSAIVQVIAAYIVVDLLTGIYHFATDKGFNFASQVAMFQDHHETNTMQGFDWQPMVVGVPALLIGLWFEQSFLLAAGSFGILAQVPHYYAHRKSPPLVRWMQRVGIIISPQHHAEHHRGDFDRNFCILSGWNNWWLNWIIGAKQ